MYKTLLTWTLLFSTVFTLMAYPADLICVEDWDKDGDGVSDYRDNCPETYNPYQDDSDGDGVGDVCDDDDCGCESQYQIIYVCQDGWTKRVYCSSLKDLNVHCGKCEDLEPNCSTCEADERGNITICRITSNGNMRSLAGRCDDMATYFNNDGTFVNDQDQCGPCTCAMIGDVDTDGDGVCDRKDECPTNPNKSEAGMCGCDGSDSDNDWVCDEDDICPGGNDKQDADQDGVPDHCDLCEGHNDAVDTDGDGVPDGCDECPLSPTGDTDGDGVCDDVDICAGGDDNIDTDDNGIPDACDVSKCKPQGNTAYEWIENVKINDWFNPSGDNDGYAEFTDPSLMYYHGDEIELWVSPGYVDQICEVSMAIFIDWNGDGDFDDLDERVYDARSLRERGRNMIIPDHAKVGPICVRFIVNYGRINDPCPQCLDGEVEDYIIVIKERECSAKSESFDYQVDQHLEGLDGGLGWSGHWMGTAMGNPSTRTLNGSLSQGDVASTGHKLGVLTPGGTRYSMRRPLSLSSDDVWLSFLYEKRGGIGAAKFGLGNTAFTIDANGYVNGQSNVSLANGETGYFVVRISMTSGGETLTRIWLNPTAATNFSIDPPVTFVTMRTTDLNTFVIATFDGMHATTPTEHYFDEVQIGCSAAEVMHTSTSMDSVVSDPGLTIAPNPIAAGQYAGITLSNSAVLQGTLNLYNVHGQLVLTQQAVAGLNTISTQGLPAGVYTLEIITSEGRYTKQLVIQE